MFVYLIAAAVGCLLLAGVLRAGSTDPFKAPYPYGSFHLSLGSYVANGLGSGTGAVFRSWIAPFDCYVKKVTKSYKGGTAHLDAVSLKTIDSTQKNVVTAGDESADVAGVVQALHSDIVGFKIVKGNGLELAADSSGSNEAGHLWFDIELEPAYHPVAGY